MVIQLDMLSVSASLASSWKNRLLWRGAVDYASEKSQQRLHALQRIVGMLWSNHTSSMLKLHSTLVTNRILYQVPLMCSSATQYERLEIIHRKGLRFCLGVPQAASNKKVIYEAKSLQLRLLASQALLTQLLRLGEPFHGKVVLRRLSTRH